MTQDEKEGILTKLLNMQSKNEQDIYLMGLMEAKPVARRRKRCENSVKTTTFVYSVKKNGNRIHVCKKAFLSLHAISNSRLQRLNTLLKAGNTPVDLRGKHNTRRHVKPPEYNTIIKDHIESFPSKTSHYSSSKVIQYLDSKLSVKAMYELLVKKWPDLKQTVKYEYYLKYFNENYSLRFGRPQVDVCSECERLGTRLKDPNLNDNAKRVTAAELMVHKRRAKKFYTQIQNVTKMCAERNDVCGITFDFMQNLPLPQIPVQEMFYYRQLWVHAFQIHNLKDNSGHFYTYHEGQAYKGPNEVCTFLWDYILNKIAPEITELHIFSDGCPGQNRNNTMVRFLLTLASSKRFKKIYHYFPIRGHSFLPCDRDFGTVKRLVRKSDRVYIPEEYETMISTCIKTKPFTVSTFTYNDILDFNNWWPNFYKKTSKSVEQKRNFAVSQYRQFTYCSETPGYVTTHDFIQGIISHTFKLVKPNVNPEFPSLKAYQEPVPINEAKIEDIKKVIQYISGEDLEFYYHIISWKVTKKTKE